MSRSADQVTYEMIAGGRIDLVLSHTGAWLLEVDGKWERCYNFRIVPAEACQLTCYGTMNGDGSPHHLYPTHKYLVELLGELCEPDQPTIGKIDGRIEGADNPHKLFGAVTFCSGGMPLLYEEVALNHGKGAYLDVHRVTITCNS